MTQIDAYGWTDGGHVESHDYLAPAVLDLLRQEKPRRVLDLGCGNGALTARLAAEGYDALGIEPSSDGIEQAKLSHPGIAFVRASAYDDIAGSQGRFDAIVSVEVIEHLYSPHRLLEEAYRALQPGGRLILTTPYTAT